MLPYSKKLKEPSRALRNDMTDAEQALWARLRRKQVHGIQFYRQKPIGPYVVDFYAPVAKLAIEVDGGQHFEAAHANRDAVRDSILAEEGLKVLRFNNRQALLETDAVMEEISRVCKERTKSPQPPFVKGGKLKPLNSYKGGKS
jgi:very-short-patch-repair endonuclease